MGFFVDEIKVFSYFLIKLYSKPTKNGNIKEFEKMFTDDAKKAVDKYGGVQDLINYVVQDGKLKNSP
ncbi:hypothetical protein P4V63_18905 [Bacillus toyonensis]|uniref:hypothetical protein n=1 Tax=Bacillus toyonensis TaxID=155322 RepID=UPI002E7BB318|nr:hypothetical protein [Bacillus toyonensis]MEE2020009.1 hypothetical protein [Bacillus toyonensis]